MNPVLCDYCGRPAEFLPSSARLYGGRDYGPAYRCDPCDAHVGVHKGTTKPLGRLANAELRALKREVHRLFDPLWILYWQAYPDLEDRNSRIRAVQRGRCYSWLAAQLGIATDECHVGMFDPDRCRAAIAAMTREKPTPASIRAWAKQQHGEAA